MHAPVPTIEVELVVFREEGDRLLVGNSLDDDGFWIDRSAVIDPQAGRTEQFGFPVVKARISRQLLLDATLGEDGG